MKVKIALTVSSLILLSPISSFAEAYTVKSGDNLWDISHRKNVNFHSLLEVNSQISNKDLIFPNQVINLPDRLNEYTVLSGDTLWDIAKKMKVDFLELLKVNPQIPNKDLIYPGQKINLPKGTKSEESKSEVTEPEVSTPEVTEPETSTPEVTEPERNDQAIVNQIIALVNEERANNGLQPLSNNADLSEVAYLKAVDMANNNYFDHTSPTYGSPFDMMKTFEITSLRAAENIAKGQRTAESVMNDWMNSPGHRANILNPNFNEIGIGYEKNEHTWVQMFIQK